MNAYNIKCKTCGSVFKVRFYRKDKAKYCSYKCYWESKKGKSYFMGKEYTKEWREKISKALKGKVPWNKKEKFEKTCNVCKRKFKVHEYRKDTAKFCSMNCYIKYMKKNPTAPHTGKKHSKKARIKMSIKKQDISVKDWNGFIQPYYPPEFNRIRKNILKRDNYTCQLCGDEITKQTKKKFIGIHHIDYDKKNNKKNNLISLCNFCHATVNTKRNDWIKLFQNKIKEVYCG